MYISLHARAHVIAELENEEQNVCHITHLRAMAAGKMNPMQTVAVAPENWKTSQMLGIKFAPKKTREISPMVLNVNLQLSEARGLDEGKRRSSKLSRSGWKITGKTSRRWRA